MTTETNTAYDTVKQAFAPVTDAFKNIQNMEVPEAAREFVKKQAETAKVRAADIHAGSEKVRGRGELFVSRAKSATEYLGKLVADGAKTAQDNFAKVYSKTA